MSLMVPLMKKQDRFDPKYLYAPTQCSAVGTSLTSGNRGIAEVQPGVAR
jgi:hypothetical protein